VQPRHARVQRLEPASAGRPSKRGREVARAAPGLADADYVVMVGHPAAGRQLADGGFGEPAPGGTIERVVSLGGGERTSLHVDGRVERSAIDHDGARRCLVDDFGVLPALALRVAADESQGAPTRSPDDP